MILMITLPRKNTKFLENHLISLKITDFLLEIIILSNAFVHIDYYLVNNEYFKS